MIYLGTSDSDKARIRPAPGTVREILSRTGPDRARRCPVALDQESLAARALKGVAGALAALGHRSLRRQTGALRLMVGGRGVTFNTLADFDFCLSSKTELPAGKYAALLQLDTASLRAEAEGIRKVEQRFADLLAQALENPGRIGRLLHLLDTRLFSQDHDWRDIIAALSAEETGREEYQTLAIAKYMQYLATRQNILRNIYAKKVRERGDKTAELVCAANPSLGETAIFDLSAADPSSLGGGTLTRLPRGETVQVRLPRDRPLDLMLANHRFQLLPGSPRHLVDESGTHHVLQPGRNLVGRHSSAGIQVDAALRSVSRRHLLIEIVTADSALVTDLSSHGTSLPEFQRRVA